MLDDSGHEQTFNDVNDVKYLGTMNAIDSFLIQIKVDRPNLFILIRIFVTNGYKPCIISPIFPMKI